MYSRRGFLNLVGWGGVSASIFGGLRHVDAAPQSMVQPHDAKRAMQRLVHLHEKKKAPEAGDWLDQFPNEKGQTFNQYLKRRDRVGQRFPRLYLQPIGELESVHERTIASIGDATSRFFGLPISELDVLSLDSIGPGDIRLRQDGTRQIRTTYLLEKLRAKRPRDAAAVIGLLSEDLYPDENWNFVFGQASLQERVGVWSTARMGDPLGNDAEQQLFNRRIIKLAWHEIGHMFGIPHCIAYECGMNGANHLDESDRQLLEYCPECQAKIWWTNNYQPLKRAEALKELAENEGWATEADYWTAAIERLRD